MPGLLQWTQPSVSHQMYSTNNFATFYPPSMDYPLGKVYSIIHDDGDRAGVYMHSYHPPQPMPGEHFLYALLSQLHPNTFVYTRFGPRGTNAVIRGRNGPVLDIVLRFVTCDSSSTDCVYCRAHVEFQLNEVPYYPFWFTPAQFAGRLIINTSSGELLHFELSLPSEKPLNVGECVSV